MFDTDAGEMVAPVVSSFWETRYLSAVTLQLGLLGFVREGLG